MIDEAQRAPALLSGLQRVIGQGQALAGVEIKAGSFVAGDAAVSLRKWQRYAGELETYLGIVNGGDEAYDRDGVSVLTWSDL